MADGGGRSLYRCAGSDSLDARRDPSRRPGGGSRSAPSEPEAARLSTADAALGLFVCFFLSDKDRADCCDSVSPPVGIVIRRRGDLCSRLE